MRCKNPYLTFARALEFFCKLRSEGKLVFLCLHPNERYHIDILRESCGRFIFVQKGVVTQAPDFDALAQDDRVRAYLGALAPQPAQERKPVVATTSQ